MQPALFWGGYGAMPAWPQGIFCGKLGIVPHSILQPLGSSGRAQVKRSRGLHFSAASEGESTKRSTGTGEAALPPWDYGEQGECGPFHWVWVIKIKKKFKSEEGENAGSSYFHLWAKLHQNFRSLQRGKKNNHRVTDFRGLS